MMVRILGEGGFAREIHARYVAQGVSSYMVDSRNADTNDPAPSLIGIADPNIKYAIDQQFVGANWISNGVIVCPGVQITVNVALGKHVHVHVNATIGHDTTIGDYTSVLPGAHVGGNVNIGKRCYIGTGVVIKHQVNICDDVVLGANATVVKDITEPGIYVGCPVKRIK